MTGKKKTTKNDNGVLAPTGLRISDAVLPKQKVLIVRTGEGINDPVPDDMLVIQIDSRIPIENRELQRDCVTVFDLDHYIPPGMRTYSALVGYVCEDPVLKKVWEKAKTAVFAEAPNEEALWEEIQENTVENSGAGALIIQGVLKFLGALRGRPYDPLRDDPHLHPGLPFRYAPKYWKDVGEDQFFDPVDADEPLVLVSMLEDLLLTIQEIDPAQIAEAGGALGGTGPSGALVLRTVLAEMGFDIVPFHMISMAEQFLTGEVIHRNTARRARTVTTLIKPAVLYSGLGWKGVFWRFLSEHAMDLAERFSNVMSFHLDPERNAAPVISVVGVPYRDDLQARWLLAKSALALGELDVSAAKKILLLAKEKGLVDFRPVSYGDGYGVQVWVNNPNSIKLRSWNELMPALAVARANVGKMNLPVTVEKNWLNSGREIKAPVAEVPHVDKILRRTRLDIDEISSATDHWAVTQIEYLLLQQVDDKPLKRAFAELKKGFIPNVREILHQLIGSEVCFPVTEVTYEVANGDSATAVFFWTQLDEDEDTTSRKLLSMFAPVDDHDDIVEQARRKAALAGARKDNLTGNGEED